ncbi:hypothetical protein BV20DRAFT_972333 [Pilatotrama ljubarskyi]|nr:hypothetical protein BV20DRAFT_972333 [Pilatotrama ljubarskyi]
MLRLALNLDYGDKIGRLKMFQLVRGMLSQDVLPEALLALPRRPPRALALQARPHPRRRRGRPRAPRPRRSCRGRGRTSEGGRGRRRDGDGLAEAAPEACAAPQAPLGDEPGGEGAHGRGRPALPLPVRIGMLERVNGTFEENSTLEDILGELIIPAVKRREMALREKGPISLGPHRPRTSLLAPPRPSPLSPDY